MAAAPGDAGRHAILIGEAAMPVTTATLSYRDEPRAADLARVREMVDATGFFSLEESAVAIELVDDRLARGPASDYRFLFGEEDGRLIGYTSYGPVAMTRASWDLYWIVVDPQAQGRGAGRALLHETERRIALAGGQRIYVETSSRAQYEPTRAFYERSGYHAAATLDDFYAPGDGKVIFVKLLAALPAAAPPEAAPG
jgi:GNAT superfamily N-acetyltransferase